MSRNLTLAFTVKVKIKARDDVVPRGHWREGSLSAQGLRTENRDWITEHVEPLTHAQLVTQVRRDLNYMLRGMGISTSDWSCDIERVIGGRKA